MGKRGRFLVSSNVLGLADDGRGGCKANMRESVGPSKEEAMEVDLAANRARTLERRGSMQC